MRRTFLVAIMLASISAGWVATGCSVSPEERLIGVWSIDEVNSTLPKPPFPMGRDRIQTALQNFRVKLLSDHHMTISSFKPTDGTWSFQGGKLDWQLKSQPFGDLVQDIKVDVTPDEQHIDVDGATLLGPIHLRLKKTG